MVGFTVVQRDAKHKCEPCIQNKGEERKHPRYSYNNDRLNYLLSSSGKPSKSGIITMYAGNRKLERT